jgi:hypothetical protein
VLAYYTHIRAIPIQPHSISVHHHGLDNILQEPIPHHLLGEVICSGNDGPVALVGGPSRAVLLVWHQRNAVIVIGRMVPLDEVVWVGFHKVVHNASVGHGSSDPVLEHP